MPELDVNKPDIVVAFCYKCNEFSIVQPNGTILEDDVLEQEVKEKEGHNGKVIKLFLRKGLGR